MSSVTVNNTTQRVTVSSAGKQGAIGLNWRDDWTTATAYAVRDAVYHEGSSYRAIAAHTSGASTEPGVGASWETVWELLALGSDVDSVAAVAAIAAQIVTVAGVAAEIATIAPYAVAIGTVAMNIAEVIAVAGISASVVAVAPSIANVDSVAGSIANVNTVAVNIANVNIAAINIAGILAAPQAAIDAGTYRDQALGYKDETAANALSTAGLKAAVDTIYANLVTLYGTLGSFNPTLAQLNGAAARVVAQTDVVAVFVYDTAKDSDGGAWRFKTVATSWFNETLNTATRGSRRQFPSRALIVARTASVTIYDLDDAACPMWMVFDRGGTTATDIYMLQTTGSNTLSVAAQNGRLIVGTSAIGAVMIDLITDIRDRVNSTDTARYNGTIAQRNAGLGHKTVASTVLSNAQVNAVAVTVLPGTPIDPVRKLPSPTVDCVTAGGISRIRYDGSVADTTGFTSAPHKGARTPGGLITHARYNNWTAWMNDTDLTAGSSVAGSTYFSQNGLTDIPAFCGTRETLEYGSSLGLITTRTSPFLRHSLGTQNVAPQNMRATRTRLYSTGYMIGNCLMALAESTADLTNLVGGTPLNDDFSTYADTAAMLAVWASSPVGGGGDPTLDTGRMAIVTTSGSIYQRASRSFATTVGATYTVVIDVTGTNCQVWIGTNPNGNQNASITTPAGVRTSKSFVATASTTYVTLTSIGTVGTSYFDNLTIGRAVADRSGNNIGPIITGTVTRAAVASGSELAAYGGFAAGNYLDVPANAALEFGTGDFYAFAWVNRTVADFQPIFCYGTGSNDGTGGWQFRLEPTILRFYQQDGAASFTYTFPTDGTNHLIGIVVRAGVAEFWLDGVRLGTVSTAGRTSSKTGSTLRIGRANNNTAGVGSASGIFANGNIALPRVGAGAPTPAQLRTMYESERKLFEVGAKCLLTGTDTIQWIGYDAKTDLLYAAKAAGGTDVFKGLVRVSTISMASENALGAELLANGSFAANITGWSSLDSGSGATSAWDAGNSGRMAMPFPSAGNFARPYQAFTTVIGQTYQLTVTGSGVESIVRVGTTQIGATLVNSSVIPTTSGQSMKTWTFVATATTTYVSFNSNIQGSTAYIDDVSMRQITSLRLNSDNHKFVSADNDNVTIATDQEVYAKTPALGLREAMTRQQPVAPYDRNTVLAPSAYVTANATPTVIGYLPMDKGEAGEWVIRVSAREYGEPAAPELASYEVRVTVHRPQEGNATVAGSATYTVVSEVTSTMDLTVAANTTVQALALTGTGVASKNIEWGYEARFAPSVQQVAA